MVWARISWGSKTCSSSITDKIHSICYLRILLDSSEHFIE